MRNLHFFTGLLLIASPSFSAHASSNQAGSATGTPIEIALPPSALMQNNAQLLSQLESATTQNIQAPQVANALENSDEDISDSDLTAIRGGEALLIGSQTLVALTQGNTITGDYKAGNVSLSDNALSGFNGVGNVVINTGAQAILQAGMNLIVNVNP